MADKSRRRGADLDTPLGLPFAGAGGFTQTPLAAISKSFKEAIEWIKSEPEDDTFSHIGLVGLVSAADAARKGEIDKAIDALRQAKREVDSARRKSFVPLVKSLLHPRRKATFLESLLSSLLNVRGVQIANNAIKKFEESKPPEDIIGRLKTMVDRRSGIDDFVEKYPFLNRDILSSAGSDPRLRRILDQYGGFDDSDFGHPSLGSCAVCHKPAAGEMRQANGNSWKLCRRCIQNAQNLTGNQEKRVSDLADALRESRKNLEEALSFDSRNEQGKTNLDTCGKILEQLNSRRSQ